MLGSFGNFNSKSDCTEIAGKKGLINERKRKSVDPGCCPSYIIEDSYIIQDKHGNKRNKVLTMETYKIENGMQYTESVQLEGVWFTPTAEARRVDNAARDSTRRSKRKRSCYNPTLWEKYLSGSSKF